jgi:hypothetical protein
MGWDNFFSGATFRVAVGLLELAQTTMLFWAALMTGGWLGGGGVCHDHKAMACMALMACAAHYYLNSWKTDVSDVKT